MIDRTGQKIIATALQPERTALGKKINTHMALDEIGEEAISLSYEGDQHWAIILA